MAGLEGLNGLSNPSDSVIPSLQVLCSESEAPFAHRLAFHFPGAVNMRFCPSDSPCRSVAFVTQDSSD